MIQLHILNSVWTELNKEARNALIEEMSYESTYWRKGSYGRKKQEVYDKKLIERHADGRYFMLSGLVNKACVFLDAQKVKYKLTSDITPVEYDDPKLHGITFRKEQLKLINAALSTGRGVILSPTGSGKTIMALGLMSCFSQESILFLVHTQDLVEQTYEAMMEREFTDVGRWYGKVKEFGRITVATIQSFAKLDMEEHSGKYDMVFVDETHHVSSLSGQYAKVLTSLDAPVKIGLTATLADKEEAKLACEALIGPVIGEVTIQEAGEIGYLAKPNIEIIEIPFNWEIDEIKKYQDAHKEGIVNNYIRNLIIAKRAKKTLDANETSLISIVNIDHGQNIYDCCVEYGFEPLFVHGGSEKEDRKKAIKGLNDGSIKCVIASNIFKEGVNIPELNNCLLADAKQGESGVKQLVGRGLRKTDDKEKVNIVDFKDTSNKYLRKHFNTRLKIYIENGWIDIDTKKSRKKRVSKKANRSKKMF